jgi:nucleotide-binding universal stress UspA family protein
MTARDLDQPPVNPAPGADQPIVVGFDGSKDADIAVDWAAAEAARRGVPLKVLHVADYGVVPAPIGLTPWRPDIVQTAAERIVAQGVERARTAVPDVRVEGAWTSSTAPAQLVRSSHEAALLVVGNRGHSEAAGVLLGSVAYSVSAHAQCPVVVVRGPDLRPAGPERPVVVGADGSEWSQAAVRFAADTAARAEAPLIVVSAYPAVDTQAWKTVGAWAVEADVMRAYVADLRHAPPSSPSRPRSRPGGRTAACASSGRSRWAGPPTSSPRRPRTRPWWWSARVAADRSPGWCWARPATG